MRQSGTPGSRVAVAFLAIFALAVAVGAGLLTGTLTLVGTLLVLGVGLVAAAVVLLRRALHVVSYRAPSPFDAGGAESPAAVDEVERAADRELRWSRALFYMGTVTVAQATFRVAGFTISELFFFGALAGSALAVLRGRTVATLPTSLLVGVGLFTFGGVISSFGADSPKASGTEVLHGIYVMLLWAWTAAMVLRTRRQTTIAITLWAVSAAIDGLGALSQVVGIHSLAGSLEGSRATGFTDHPNDLGGATAIALVPCLLLTARTAPGQAFLSRMLPWALLSLTAAGLILSASVTGMAVALAGIVIWLSLPSVRTPSRVAVLAGLASALLVLAVAGGGITSPAKRIEQVTSPAGTSTAAGSGEIRITEAKTAWPRIEENPVVGTGLDTSDTVVTILSGGQVRSYQTHGAPLAVWYGAGIFGLLGILVIFGTLLRSGWKSLGSATSEDDVLTGWALVASAAAFVLFTMAVPFSFQQYGWFASVMLLAWCARRGAVGAHVIDVDEAPAAEQVRRWPREAVTP